MSLTPEVLYPEKCILCHKPRRDPSVHFNVAPNKSLPETPFCHACFHSTQPVFRETLMWTRRHTLAREALLESNGLESAIKDAIALLREMNVHPLPTFPLDESVHPIFSTPQTLELVDQFIKRRLLEMTAAEQSEIFKWFVENRKTWIEPELGPTLGATE